jgi:hypothetical protein
MDPKAWLEAFVARHGGVAGTVHTKKSDQELELSAAFRIPPQVVERVRTIPRGKGMAGLAWERGEPVSTCNLKTDATGDVRPGAKAVDAQAAVALPVYAERGELRAVVGVAFTDEREIDAEELATLSVDAATLP